MFIKLWLLVGYLMSLCLPTYALGTKFIIGTNAEFPPFCYLEKGEIVGFDIDIAKEVAKRNGKEAEFKDMPFDALLPALFLGQVDFVAAGMSATEERAKRVAFTRNYLSGDPFIILTKGKQAKGIADLAGKQVAVVEGFTSDLWLTQQPGLNIVRLPTQADGFMSLMVGRVDAFVTAQSTADAFFEKQAATDFQIYSLKGTSESCALMLSKKQPKLLQELQHTLDEMESDQTIAKLKAKWNLK